MRFGSVCSGIEAASVAWEPLGWRADWFAEIEKFPSAVLAPAVTVALRGRDGGATAELGGEVATDLRASTGGGDKPHVLLPMAVRRLTPRECERLQGFPDNHTLVPHRGKPAADGPRYKAIGNSMAVPVMRWIGARIQQHLQAQAQNDNTP